MNVVIPAFRPGQDLLRLVNDLSSASANVHVLVVDDGSGHDYKGVFEESQRAGATVLHLPTNLGKGAALKTAFRHLEACGAKGAVVTADADGQHAVADIVRVAAQVDPDRAAPPHLVLGERTFDTAIPFRSQIGNVATRTLFRVATGRRLRDTQTGLRAFPCSLLPWLLTLAGDRYDYELVQLLEATRAGVELRSVPIRTIYSDGNSGSHFRPVVDSLRIYAPLLMFLASSFSAFLIDSLLLLGLAAVTGNLLVAVLGARLVSAGVNFVVNRRVIFRGSDRWTRAARRYIALAIALVCANYLILHSLVTIGMPLLLAKVVTETLLVAASYAVQASFVYGRTTEGVESGAPHDRCQGPTGHRGSDQRPAVPDRERPRVAGRVVDQDGCRP